jgi:hypothetical protein
MNSDKENKLLNRLESVEKRIESIESSITRLVEAAERRTDRREAGLLVLGAIFGGLLGIVVNLWTDYYMVAIAPEINIPTLVGVTVALAAFFTYLLWWTRNQLR